MRKIFKGSSRQKASDVAAVVQADGFPADARAKGIIGAANGILGGSLARRGGCVGNSDLKRWGHDDLSS